MKKYSALTYDKNGKKMAKKWQMLKILTQLSHIENHKFPI